MQEPAVQAVGAHVAGGLDGPTAIVDLTAIAHNVRVIVAHTRVPVMAVVKADGYGHGAVQVARTALSAGAAELGVTTVREALDLRAAGITAPILSWLSSSGFQPAIAADVRLGVGSLRQLHAIAADARALGRPAVVDLKIDTGLSRNGVTARQWDEVRDALVQEARAGTIRLHGVFTHLAFGHVPDHPFHDVQHERLEAAAADLARHGLTPVAVHLADSAITMSRPDLHLDLVRPGLAIYGRRTIAGRDFGLRPAMTFVAPVMQTKRLAAGEGVSYGHTWIAPEDTVIGLIPAGYADGVQRRLSGKLEVSIDGRRYPSVGLICMDQFVVCLGADGGGVQEGDIAVLFGGDRPGEPTALEWADHLGTSDIEVLTSVRGRTSRRYTTGDDG